MAERLFLSVGDETFTATVSEDLVELEPGGARITVPRGVASVSGDDVWVSIDGEVFVVEVRRSTRRDRRGARDHAAFTAPMPATVVRIAVTAGATVQAGDVLIALEAMKMELPIRAPRDGVVRAVLCREGELVQPDQELLEFE